MAKNRVPFFVFLAVYAVACRLLPYALGAFGMSIHPATTWFPWNFSPLMAAALFSGACAADRKWSFGLPLAVLVISDFGIWALTGDRRFAFTQSTPLIYGCFAAAAAFGMAIRSQPQVITAVPLAIAAESFFFLASNFAVWVAGEGESYPLTAQGLALCYAMAIPFFGRSLISTILYAAALFSPAGLRLAGVERAEAQSSEARF